MDGATWVISLLVALGGILLQEKAAREGGLLSAEEYAFSISWGDVSERRCP